MPLTNGSGSCYLVVELQDANKKIIFLKKFICFLLFEGRYIIFPDPGGPKTGGSVGSGAGTLVFLLLLVTSVGDP
jgi:hypothetical protein